MEYRNKSTAKILSKLGIKLANPNMSFPAEWNDDVLESLNLEEVTTESIPEINEQTQNLTLGSEPTLKDGKWAYRYTIEDKTSEELVEVQTQLKTSARNMRNALLFETDFYALGDVTMSDAIKTYRQALRDLPAHKDWPNVDFPTKPEE